MVALMDHFAGQIHRKEYTQMVLLESLKTDLKAGCIGRALSNLYGAKLHNENWEFHLNIWHLCDKSVFELKRHYAIPAS